MGTQHTPDDKRSLSHEALEDIRISTVRRVREAGESPEELARILGFSRTAVYNWLRAYDAGGIDALRAKPVPGRPPRLTDEQLDWIRAVILATSPLDWRFDTTLWTRRMVAEMIESLYGVSYSEESAGRLMREKMGLLPQRPVRRAAEQDPEAVRCWLVEEYPKIAAQARDEKAQIYFGDEASERSDHHLGTTWGSQGETPVIEKTGKRVGIKLICAISAEGTMRYMEIKGRKNAEHVIEFLKRLINTHDQPIYFIVDDHPSHKAKKVLTFVEKNRNKLKLFFLPAYSPQLNPDELVWNQLKNHYTGKHAISTITEL